MRSRRPPAEPASAVAPPHADVAADTTAPTNASPANDQTDHTASVLAGSGGRATSLGAPRMDSKLLAGEWRRLRQAATAVAIFTAPLFFVVMYDRVGLSSGPALAVTVGAVIAFRGLIDVAARRLLPVAEHVRGRRLDRRGGRRGAPPDVVLALDLPQGLLRRGVPGRGRDDHRDRRSPLLVGRRDADLRRGGDDRRLPPDARADRRLLRPASTS